MYNSTPSDNSFYDDLFSTLLWEVKESYSEYLDCHSKPGLGKLNSVKYYDAELQTMVACDNSFTHFVLGNAEYLLSRMKAAMPTEASCVVLTKDLTYVCKSYAEKALNLRPKLVKPFSFRRRYTRDMSKLDDYGTIEVNRNVEELMGKLTEGDINLLSTLFEGMSVRDFCAQRLLDGEFFGKVYGISLTATPIALYARYPNADAFIRGMNNINRHKGTQEESTANLENVFYFWIVFSQALEECIKNRIAYNDIKGYILQD
tara:strand:- start:1054 stop:1833 length:780 start_codon:yes stop_codon:yes gene_type:complete